MCAAIGALPLAGGLEPGPALLAAGAAGARAFFGARCSGSAAAARSRSATTYFCPTGARPTSRRSPTKLTHCAQYQAWGPWRYYIRGAAAQLRDLAHRVLGVGRSPYAYTASPGRPFDAYGMEQQAQIVEDALRGSAAARAITAASARAS